MRAIKLVIDFFGCCVISNQFNQFYIVWDISAKQTQFDVFIILFVNRLKWCQLKVSERTECFGFPLPNLQTAFFPEIPAVCEGD